MKLVAPGRRPEVGQGLPDSSATTGGRMVARVFGRLDSGVEAVDAVAVEEVHSSVHGLDCVLGRRDDIPVVVGPEPAALRGRCSGGFASEA
ncbi:hypothetical protein BV210_03290 [Halorientalis sp. IM1011]|nr:hypothetical protein BV210_03290 [Halorientalis sp. IM1011]